MLSPEEFRDNVRLRYGLEPLNLPDKCDACHCKFTVEHAISCQRGGLVIMRHDEVSAEWAELCSHALVPSAVSDEPSIPTSQDPNGATGNGANPANPVPAATRADVGVRNFWRRGTQALFDIRITDTDGPSNRSAQPAKVLERHEKEKKKKYLAACIHARKQFMDSAKKKPTLLSSG